MEDNDKESLNNLKIDIDSILSILSNIFFIYLIYNIFKIVFYIIGVAPPFDLIDYISQNFSKLIGDFLLHSFFSIIIGLSVAAVSFYMLRNTKKTLGLSISVWIIGAILRFIEFEFAIHYLTFFTYPIIILASAFVINYLKSTNT